MIVDADHQIPSNVGNLVDILDNDESIGGVSGLFFENNSISGMYHDFDFENDYLIRDVQEKDVEYISGLPFVEFEFIANAALFRRSVFSSYNWDPNYVIEGEHEDFYLGHLDTDWRFGVTPTVLFPHNPGGSTGYLLERFKPEKDQDSREYLLQKHDLNGLVTKNTWLWTGPLPNILHEKLPISIQYRIVNSIRTFIFRSRYILNRWF